MALKKSQLYSSLWQSCDELRGGMDASQYKDYVLTLLFVKYVSDKHAADTSALIEVPVGGSFDDMVKLKGDKEIGDRINKIIGRLAEANDLKGVIDQADFNDESKLGGGKEMQDRLSKLVAIFEGLDFRANRIGGDDLLGDAYEYLMRHFATESGKSKGQFYTPAEVSRIIAQVVGIGPNTRQSQTIYDPTCGSGSLLLKAADEAPSKITVYGQEADNATWSLARMNLILHGHETAEIWRGNTLAAPGFKNSHGGLKTFDFAVANPPFSAKAWSNGLDPAHDLYGRFSYGVPPAKNGDYAFLLHLVRSLKSRGKGAIILPHGVLFRGNREADIRLELVRRGLIRGIIGLPANLFYGTGIPACIVVIDKEGAATRDGIFMVDASRGFLKDGNKNRLRERDIHRIVNVFIRQTEVPHYSRMVPLAEIAGSANNYNLNLPRYIDSPESEDLHDIDAHLHGGIPDRDIDALGEYWSVLPSVRKSLFASSGRGGYSTARVGASEVKAAILENDEFRSFATLFRDTFAGWCEAHRGRLLKLDTSTVPRSVIGALSEDLLRRFSNLALLDPYSVYQRLMDYWGEAMQDDIYLVVGDGWIDTAQPREIVGQSKRKLDETPDLIVKGAKYKLDLIPPVLVIARFFGEEQRKIEVLQEELNTLVQELDEFIEEHSGADGLLEEALIEKSKPALKDFQGRLKAIQDGPESHDECAVLQRCIDILKAKSKASKAVKDAQAALDARVLARYSTLSEGQIKTLVVDDKWLASILSAVQEEVQWVSQRLAARIQEIEERYARPLLELEREVDAFKAKVEGHLARMGLSL